MKRLCVEVNDRMQQGYVYSLTEPQGKNFHPDFDPQLTPKQMLELGVFGGKYMTDCARRVPADWFAKARLCAERHDPKLNYFGVNASQPLVGVAGEGLDLPRRPARLVPVVLPVLPGHGAARTTSGRFSAGGRCAGTSRRSRRTAGRGDLTCRPRQRQALLHWAYDSRTI